MGTRINNLIQQNNDEGVVCAVMYSNSATVDAEALFREAAAQSNGTNDLISRLLKIRYDKDDPLMRQGFGVFVFDSHPYDNEKILKVSWNADDKAVVSECETLEQQSVLQSSKDKHGARCKQCETELRIDGFCKDITCPFSDWPQRAELFRIQCESAEQYEAAEGLQRRQRVDANAYSDDRKADVDFDAGPYFWHHQQQGTLGQILGHLIACEFARDDASDEVARFFSEDETKPVFDATGVNAEGDMIGFECSVDEQTLRRWVARNAPEHLSIMQAGLAD